MNVKRNQCVSRASRGADLAGLFNQYSAMSTHSPAVHGRILDLDAHLQMPASFWSEVFGHSTAQFGKQFIGNPFFDDVFEPELTVETAWKKKGSAAPGATTPEGSLATMDIMGIERQLIFP